MAMTADLRPAPATGSGWFAFAGLFLVGTAVDAVCRYHPADLPYVLPWDFSWPVFLVTFVTLGWYWHGLRRMPVDDRPALWRTGSFVFGVIADYAVLQTHIDYLAQHMFFIHRAAHFVLLYPAPILIALSESSRVICAGMPDFLRPALEARVLQRFGNFIQHPAIATVLVTGLLYFWLVPQIHTRVMLDANLHDAMDWSIAISAIVFWSLALDRRPKPPASATFRMRLALILLVLLPQIALGAVLWTSVADVYPIYAICGRLFAMTALDDQHLGGLIIMLSSSAMSIVAILIVMSAMRRDRMAADGDGA